MIVCKYTSLFNFIIPISQKQFFAVALYSFYVGFSSESRFGIIFTLTKVNSLHSITLQIHIRNQRKKINIYFDIEVYIISYRESGKIALNPARRSKRPTGFKDLVCSIEHFRCMMLSPYNFGSFRSHFRI